MVIIFIFILQLFPKFRNVDPVPLTVDLLNPKSKGFDMVSRTTIVPGFKSFRSGVFVLSS